MLNLQEKIYKLEKESDKILKNWSILMDAENLIKENGFDTYVVYQLKLIYASKYVELRKQIEELAKTL